MTAAVGTSEDERKRRRAEEEEEELTRRRLFGSGSDDDSSNDLPRSPFDDDSFSWKPEPAGDSGDWLAEPDSPGASRRAVDALCESLFHAEDRQTPRKTRPTNGSCYAADAADAVDSGASPPLSGRLTNPPEAAETPHVQPNNPTPTPTGCQEIAWGVSPRNIGDNEIPKAPTGRHKDASRADSPTAGATGCSPASAKRSSTCPRRSLFTRFWPLAALLLAGFFGWMAFASGGPEPDVRETLAAQSAQATPSDASDRYVTVPIQDIRKGDYVLATHPETGEQVPRKVVDAFSRVVNRLRILEVRTESGRIVTIRTTDEHPFWVDDTEDFLPAGDLQPGDSFHGPTGEKTTLVSTRSEDHPEGVVVYNFEVEGSHTYFVLTQGEDGLTGAGVLVHNAVKGDCGGAPRPKRRLPKKGTKERNEIEAARKRGCRAREAQELENIRNGGKGAGVWTEDELRQIRETGVFPDDVEWHHDPTVANRPDLAADPDVIEPIRGGREGHLDAHGGNWQLPR